MDVPIFIELKHANWQRFAWVLGGIVAVWAALAAILPPKIYTIVSVCLTAVQTAITYFMRSGVYADQRSNQPQQ